MEVAPDVEILAVLDSIIETIDWFGTHAMPDLVFLDIHLADGSAFEIFSHVEIACPIIFTTAYDEYALRAFKVNSIDYLLKPIDGHDIRKALDKMDCLHGESSSPGNEPDYSSLIRALKKRRATRHIFWFRLKGIN